jgi:hypothetical protein
MANSVPPRAPPDVVVPPVNCLFPVKNGSQLGSQWSRWCASCTGNASRCGRYRRGWPHTVTSLAAAGPTLRLHSRRCCEADRHTSRRSPLPGGALKSRRMPFPDSPVAVDALRSSEARATAGVYGPPRSTARRGTRADRRADSAGDRKPAGRHRCRPGPPNDEA